MSRGSARRGVILAVCSKNTDSIAREVFEKHPEMALRLDDISCFVANWDDKASNLVRIAEQLNIGLNSLVFVDDNPAERSIVRRLRPEVAVPELPVDASGYIMALERHRYFQPLSLSAEDLKRTDYYRADSARQAAESSAEELGGFLKSLEMSAVFGPIVPATLERAAQLIQRSNQFNLTTRRHSAADLQAMMADDRWLTRTVSLRDRFGDNGLISVLLAKVAGDVLEIDTWLMSCRVLKRGVEQYLMNRLCEFARDRGLRRCGASTSPRPRTPWSATTTPASDSPASTATSPGAPPGNSRSTRAGHPSRPTSRRAFPMEPLRSELQEVFRQVFGDDEIVLSDSTTADDVDGWDSMMHLNLIIGMEKRFGVKFAAAEIAAMKAEGQNVGTLVQLLERKIAAEGAGRS